MPVRILTLIFILLLPWGNKTLAVEDNLDFANELADSSIEKFLEDFDVANNGFSIRAMELHPANFIMEQSIISYLKGNNGKVFLLPSIDSVGSEEIDYILEFKIIGLLLNYDNAPKSKRTVGRDILRDGSLVSIFRLLSVPDREVRLTEEIMAENEDVISKRQAREFTRKGNFYIAPELSGGYKRFLEPILVGSAIATLVVLFFSNR
ncbi:MAG: hypothetical protein GF315_13095 [candidate division Zixibacteria bacterium]|nr:hypothetical protein [candidate division Zixibacteria bacterium]